MIFHKLIQGSSFSDERGGLNFFNSLDMNQIIRMYEISPSDIANIRGWQAHKTEKKWFYCNSGAFIINLVEVDNFESPSKAIVTKQYVLDALKPCVLEVTGGYATAFRAKEAHSKLIVFSNFSLDASKEDDFRYPVTQWTAEWK